MNRLASIVLFALLLILPRAARAEPSDPSLTLSPYFFVDDGPGDVEAFPLESTQVLANVSGVIADVQVRQTYRNDGTRPIHARYVFPASTRAAVHGMEILVGNRRVVARIKEREAAAAEFKKAAADGKTASLLSEERPNVFTMAVANILPGDRVAVTLRYSELLVPTDGKYQFVYPTVVGPRYSHEPAGAAPPTDKFIESPYLHAGSPSPTVFSIEVGLSTGVPIADLRSSTHRIDVSWGSDRSLVHVALAHDQGFGGDRDFILQYRLAGDRVQSGLLLSEGPDENHFLLMVQPPARVEPASIPSREYIFVLDVSGSMSGFPLDTAKGLLTDLVQQLRPTDTFNVELFSGASCVLAPSSLPATQDNVQRALGFISQERGGGGTELEAALGRALGLPRSENVSRSVVVITDGYIAQERGAFELVERNLSTTNVFAFGIGSGVNRYLIEGLARVGRGEPFVVTSPAEATEAALRFRRYIEAPVLLHVAVQMHGFDAYDVEPPQQPDLFAARPVVVIGKWRGPRQGTIEVTAQGAAGPFSQTVDVGGTSARPENAALPQLWARTRIARLSDFDADGNDALTTRAVTDLGLRYSLLTRYTSFIAVLEQVRNTEGQAQNVDQPLPLPLGVSDLAVGGYASGAEPELVWVLGLALWVLVATAYRNRAGVAGGVS
jgi:Ca-activated chloride channel family protein